MTVRAPFSQSLEKYLVIFFLFCVLTGCGRYGNPFPPEALAPQSVENLSARATDTSVILAWSSPRNDLRGRELRSLNGYNIYREELFPDLLAPAALTREALDRELIATIPDLHVDVREELRLEARERGEITRRVRVDPSLMNFEFSDDNLSMGRLYRYTVVPFNQGRVEGRPGETVEVLFRGSLSRISIGTRETEADDGIFDTFLPDDSIDIP